MICLGVNLSTVPLHIAREILPFWDLALTVKGRGLIVTVGCIRSGKIVNMCWHFAKVSCKNK